MRLQGKTALITGAGSGMGSLAAEMFAREGAAVVATDIAPEGLQATVERVRSAGGNILGLVGDVCRAEDVRRWVEEAVKAYGNLHILYNNAGIFPDEDGSVIDLNEDVYQRVMDVNVKGVSLCCKFGVPELIRSGGGSIVNIASFVALLGCTVPQDAYTASKGAVLSLTRSLAVQLGPHNIRANAICPGPILTPMLESLFPNEEERLKRLNRIPMRRFGQAEDVVYAALYLASDESSWVTGSTFVVDGGISVNYF
ncbi:MAG: short-chain dehydrogenase [Chloroflexi bacterium RBG_16_68_14]|nr:MAG: short-chain dehydrogenase [Chloroflexi bacterium RBG_16_68_14]